ncbi:MAG: glycosyltransferase [Candidatus Lernaella stagnicola]|nr:glycosyltransferase [Candidatus Lernaella stagnicola]
MTLRGRDIVCLASAAWDAMWVNSQHVMHRLAKHNRVLYVNNLGLRPPTASSGDWQKIKKKLGEWTSGARQVENNLWVVAPVSLPLHRRGTVRAFNAWNLRRTLRAWTTKFGMQKPILWSFLPLGATLVGDLDESLVVYHCVDDYAANPGVPATEIREMESRLLAAADLTIVTNPVLYEERKSRAANIEYFGNVADVEHFAPRPDRRVPEALRDLPRPIIGYHGNISGYKTDVPLMAALARAMPHASIVLIGPVGWGDPHTDVASLRELPNVVLLDRVPYDALPSYVAAFDVAILPLHDNESTRRSFPMKFYEYMAAEKPIVARDLPAFDAYRDRPELCRLAKTEKGFITAVGEALAAPPALEARRAEAKRNSWDVRMAQIEEAVVTALQAKGKGSE